MIDHSLRPAAGRSIDLGWRRRRRVRKPWQAAEAAEKNNCEERKPSEPFEEGGKGERHRTPPFWRGKEKGREERGSPLPRALPSPSSALSRSSPPLSPSPFPLLPLGGRRCCACPATLSCSASARPTRERRRRRIHFKCRGRWLGDGGVGLTCSPEGKIPTR